MSSRRMTSKRKSRQSRRSTSKRRKSRQSRRSTSKRRKSRQSRRSTSKRRKSRQKTDGMEKISRAFKTAYGGLTGLFPQPPIVNSYNWYMGNLDVEDKPTYIKGVIVNILNTHVGIPNYGRDWSDEDINYFFDKVKDSHNNNIPITYELINTLIIEKNSYLEKSVEEEYDMVHTLYPPAKCGNIGNFYKVKDNDENLILVEIKGYDFRKQKCEVQDVYTKVITSINPDILEKRAKDMSNDEISAMSEKIKSYITNGDRPFLYPAWYSRIDKNT